MFFQSQRIMVKIVIIDNENLYSYALQSVFGNRPGYEEPLVFTSGLTFLGAVNTIRFDLILLDISMPDASGLIILEKLLAIRPEAKVIILSYLCSREPILQAFQLGAQGFITKESEIEDIFLGIESVLNGEIPHLSPSISTGIKAEIQKSKSNRQWPQIASLTSKENEVLQLLALGETTKGIAEKLAISVRTAENHRRHIMEKLQVHNSTALIAKAVKRGLVCI